MTAITRMLPPQRGMFFDEDYEHEMVGCDGSMYLRRVYTRDSAFCIVLMSYLYHLPRINAVINMKVRDYFVQGCRGSVRLYEKGSKEHELPGHRARPLPAEILDDRRRISNPGFARDVHQRLPVDDADGAPSEHRVAKSCRHARRQIDIAPVPFEEIDQRRQGPVAAKARAVIFRLPRREAVHRPTAGPRCDDTMLARRS